MMNMFNRMFFWCHFLDEYNCSQVGGDTDPRLIFTKKLFSNKYNSSENFEKARGDPLPDQHLHRLHHRQLPHNKDHSKCLGDCSQVKHRQSLFYLQIRNRNVSYLLPPCEIHVLGWLVQTLPKEIWDRTSSWLSVVSWVLVQESTSDRRSKSWANRESKILSSIQPFLNNPKSLPCGIYPFVAIISSIVQFSMCSKGILWLDHRNKNL